MKTEILIHQIGKDPMYKVWHALEKTMIIYMHSDGGSIVCSEKAYPIKRGVLCFAGVGKYHYTMPDNPNVYERSKLIIPSEKLRDIVSLIGGENNFGEFGDNSFVYAQLDDEGAKEAENLLAEIKKHENDSVFKESFLVSNVIKLLALIKRYHIERVPGAVGVVGKGIEYINSNIFADVNIDKICKAIHVSKYYFCHKFKQSTGMTVMEYILKTRIIMAKNMLRGETLSVTEISNKCGFSSISYFSRVFKQETGITPLKYRKSVK